MTESPLSASSGFDRVVKVKEWHLRENKLFLNVITANGREAQVIFQVISPAIWHFIFIPPRMTPQFQKETIQQKSRKPPLLSVEEKRDGIIATAGKFRLIIQPDPWSFRIGDQAGRSDLIANTAEIDGLGQSSVLLLGYREVDGAVSAVTGSFHLRPQEALYGLGEKFTRLNKVGQKIISWTQDALGSTSERSHKNIPLLISSRGYGLFLNSSARITWNLGTTSCQSYTIYQESSFLDGYFLFGPAPSAILKHYHQLTGSAPLPPRWSFGLWLSVGGTYRDQKSAELLLDGLQKYRIPADVFHIDTWWMRWRKYCDFQWDREAYPDVDGLFRKLRDRRLKLSLWIQPYISVETEIYDPGKRLNYFVKRPDGEVYVIEYGLSLAPRPDGLIRKAGEKEGWNAPVAIVDFTNPEAVRWFQDLARPALQQGADVYKTDFGEDIPEDAVFHNGETGKTMHNLYPLLYNQAIFETVKQEKKCGLVWSRSGCAGSQRYPVCWSGDPAADWDSLAATIRGGLSVGMSGIPFWSHDIGGYRGMPSPDLYVRWAQFGLFCSHSRMHGDSPRQPWYFNQKVMRIVRRYINLRYSFFPYLYCTAIEATLTGMPVIRAMTLAFPDDRLAAEQDLQYMLGPWLLVAPVCNSDGRINVYLPPGNWIDFYTEKVHYGPKSLKMRVPLARLPLFVRGGAIVPAMPSRRRIPSGKINPLILEIYPSQKSTYTFHDENGKTGFSCHPAIPELQFHIRGKTTRDYILRFHSEFSRQSISLEIAGKTIFLPDRDIQEKKKYLQVTLNHILSANLKIRFTPETNV